MSKLQKGQIIYGKELFKVTHDTTKFGDHRNCDIGAIMLIVFHMISEDHVIKGTCDFIGRSPSK